MYKALKPCTLAGRKFIIGDEIPADLVLNPQKLIKNRMIVEVAENLVSETQEENAVLEVEKEALIVPIYEKDEVINLSLSAEQIVEVVTILQHTVDEAEKTIKDITSEDELIVIHKLDPRKGVKEAAENRANELEEAKAKANADANSNTNVDPDGDGNGDNGSNNTAGGDNEGNNADGSGEA